MRVLVTAFKAFALTAYLAVVVCVLTNVLHSTLPGKSGSVNVTRDEYNLALSKWQLQGAAEYEMVVEYGGNGCGPGDAICGTWTLRVSGSKIFVLGYRSGDNPGRPRVTAEELGFLTVDSLFEEVDKTLAGRAQGKDGLQADYSVWFDPELGYPRQIWRGAFRPGSGFASAEGSDWSTVESVTRLRVTGSK